MSFVILFPSMCTLEEFRGFFLAKAFDVVGNGTYRKHLARCKDVGDPWAVTMSAQLQSVQSHAREVHTAVMSMPQSNTNRLAEICKDVMMSAQPPIRLHAGCSVCCITGRRCMKCLDLSKTHKSHAHVHVDPRFCFFFMLLWYCNKLEYIVRSYTRTWLDIRSEDETFKDICCALQVDMESQIVQMHKLFLVAKEHVLCTLKQYTDCHKLAPILELPHEH